MFVESILGCSRPLSGKNMGGAWWAAKHRHHHLHSDTDDDVHSPRHTGFLYSHMGWIFARRHDTFDMVKVDDLRVTPS
jgi:stearoyl-CoA desaturase (Delta-9 desaturase)